MYCQAGCTRASIKRKRLNAKNYTQCLAIRGLRDDPARLAKKVRAAAAEGIAPVLAGRPRAGRRGPRGWAPWGQTGGPGAGQAYHAAGTLRPEVSWLARPSCGVA